jgi:hypothetical protein
MRSSSINLVPNDALVSSVGLFLLTDCFQPRDLRLFKPFQQTELWFLLGAFATTSDLHWLPVCFPFLSAYIVDCLWVMVRPILAVDSPKGIFVSQDVFPHSSQVHFMNSSPSRDTVSVRDEGCGGNCHGLVDVALVMDLMGHWF